MYVFHLYKTNKISFPKVSDELVNDQLWVVLDAHHNKLAIEVIYIPPKIKIPLTKQLW